ncbi:hypothetical protein BpHYR1_014802 [Brachionus plicatilis]|uniref:Uncharacterized protein n=1 Tax=Brachionus plicatilis TaxID=10195 RepID=A0A3M7SSK4_BRAPC|nr:hypothetical protein BpHYR1_014802 [Brachionus plicatilis]
MYRTKSIFVTAFLKYPLILMTTLYFSITLKNSITLFEIKKKTTSKQILINNNKHLVYLKSIFISFMFRLSSFDYVTNLLHLLLQNHN